MRLSPLTRQPPICSLPIELLSYILLLGTHSPPIPFEKCNETQELPPFDTDSVKAPLIYSAVCRQWRSVALGTAALWTSICITVSSMDLARADHKKHLDLTHVNSYLSLSRKYPLNILFDARDMDWDFSEPEISLSDFSDYSPPFTEDNVRIIFSVLLPHLYRWRTIDIFTDTWAPMHTMLYMLDGPLNTNGAPLLESLTLMRCNDYISHSPLFQPSSMKSPELLSSSTSQEPNRRCPLPRLLNLTLRGVHVNWSGLALLHPSLVSLELSSHSLNVRPTQSEFRDLLYSCRNLKSLIINSSGFVSDDEDSSLKTGVHNINKNVEPIALPSLEQLKIGYRSVHEGCDILGHIHSPNICQLSLEDATHPGEIDEVEADELLLFIAGLRSSSITPKSSPLFPSVRKVIFKRIRAQSGTFRKLLSSMPYLRSLELHMMPKLMDAIRAMLPTTFDSLVERTSQRLLGSRSASLNSTPTSSSPASLCPQLQEFCLWAVNLSPEDLRCITKDLILGRSETGARSLKRLDIHLVDGTDSSFEDVEGVGLRIFKAPLDVEDDDGLYDSTREALLNEEFQYGGIFNDPIFDAQYSSSVFSH